MERHPNAQMRRIRRKEWFRGRRDAAAGLPWAGLSSLAYRDGYLEADRTVKLASKCPPLSVMQWAKGRGYPAPWGSDVFAAYKEHIRAALAVLGRA